MQIKGRGTFNKIIEIADFDKFQVNDIEISW